MTIILERYPPPEKGELTISETVTIRISADEAQRIARRWLLDEVSYMLGAEGPVFVIGAETGWQIPVVYSAPHVGRATIVGNVMVDAKTGYILNPVEARSALEEKVRAYVARLSPFRMHETSAEYSADAVQPTRAPGQPAKDIDDMISPSSQN